MTPPDTRPEGAADSASGAAPDAAAAGAPLITLIAAMARERVIGRDNRIPWHLPADLAHFRRLTLDRPLVLGRRTWESLPGPLPRRRLVVVSREPGFTVAGAEVVASPAAALALLADQPVVMIGGGAALYAALLPRAGRLELTLIDAHIQGDRLFPAWSPADWRETARTHRPADAANAYDLDFVTLERR